MTFTPDPNSTANLLARIADSADAQKRLADLQYELIVGNEINEMVATVEQFGHFDLASIKARFGRKPTVIQIGALRHIVENRLEKRIKVETNALQRERASQSHTSSNMSYQHEEDGFHVDDFRLTRLLSDKAAIVSYIDELFEKERVIEEAKHWTPGASGFIRQR